MELGNMNMAEEARLARVSQLTTNRRRLRAAKRSMRSQIEVLERDIERVVGSLS